MGGKVVSGSKWASSANSNAGCRSRKELYGAAVLPTALWAVFLILFPLPLHAVSLIQFQDARDYALAPGFYVPGRFVHENGVSGKTAFVFSAGEIRLFEIPGLKLDMASLSIRFPNLVISGHSSMLSSGVGGQKLFGIEASSLFVKNVYLSICFRYFSVGINGTLRSCLLTCTAKMHARLSEFWSLGYTLNDYSLYGEKIPGIDVSVFTGCHPTRGTAFLACVSLSREGAMSTGISADFHFVKILRLTAAYEDSSEMFKSALSIRWRKIECVIFSGFHPVLGVSKGISLAWEV